MRDQQINADERRDYFRVEDKVLLTAIPSSEAAAKSGQIPAAFQQNESLNLVTELQGIDHDNQQLLTQLGHQNKELEAYLRSLNKKIDLIASKVASDQHDSSRKQTVILSEGGIGFHSPQPFAVDSVIALQLSLLPSYVNLSLFAKVVDCKTDDTGYSIASTFITLSDANRQILARHIMQVQLAAKRQQSDNSND